MTTTIRHAVYDYTAGAFRRLPSFRGKGLLGTRLADFLGVFPTGVVNLKDGSRLRLDARSYTEHWTFWTGEYDSHLIARLAHCLGERSVVLDIGANVGLWTVQLGRRLQKLRGRLFAFEPMARNHERLDENVALNGLSETVKTVRCALGDDTGTVRLSMDRRRGAVTGNAIIVGPASGDCAQEDVAPLARLDDLDDALGVHSCRLVKMDIEGAELSALLGGQKFFSRYRPIIYGEFNPHHMAGFGHTVADVGVLLRRWGYRVFRELRGSRFAASDGLPQDEATGVLLVPDETPDDLLREMGAVSPSQPSRQRAIASD